MGSNQPTMNKQRMTAKEQLWPGVVGAVFVLLTIYPLWFNRPDSFPLSTYPMFARPRGNPELVKLVALTQTGEYVSVPPRLLGTTEVLQAKAQLNQIASRGTKAKKRYCEAVATRVTQRPDLQWQELQLQRARFSPIEYFESGNRPLSVEVLTRCSIQRPSPVTNESAAIDD